MEWMARGRWDMTASLLAAWSDGRSPASLNPLRARANRDSVMPYNPAILQALQDAI